MSGELFQEWVEGLDNKFLAQKRKFALKAIKLVFLPPNTKFKTQPMDQGVIRSLKSKYRTVLVQKYIRAIDQPKSLQKLAFWMQWTY